MHADAHNSASAPIRDILSFPPDEQLDVALAYINALVPAESSYLDHYFREFGLRPMAAQVAHLLAKNAPFSIPPERLEIAIYGGDPVPPKGAAYHVYACRKAGIEIHSMQHHGYWMLEPEAERIKPSRTGINLQPAPLANLSATRHKARWTRKDDIEVLRNPEAKASELARHLKRSKHSIENRRAYLKACARNGVQPAYRVDTE